MGAVDETTSTPLVEDCLVCFVLKALSTAYVIPVGSFVTRCLKNDKLYSITMGSHERSRERGLSRSASRDRQPPDKCFTFQPFFSGWDIGSCSSAPTAGWPDPLFLYFNPNHLIKNHVIGGVTRWKTRKRGAINEHALRRAREASQARPN